MTKGNLSGARRGTYTRGSGRRRLRRTLAVVALALAPAAPLACDGDPGTGPEDDDADRGLAAVSITPSEATLEARRDTVDLGVSGRTPSGREIEDFFVYWSATRPGVVDVDRVGLVTARDTGRTRIVAVLRENDPGSRVLAADTALVAVTGLVAETVLRPPGASLESVGDTVGFRAEAVDAAGIEVEGVTFAFASTDTAVLTLGSDDGRTVVATAADTGTARVVATPSTGPRGRAPVEVARPEPRVDAVRPDTLTEGEPANVRGRHLESVVSAPVVRVDGLVAEVTAVADTALRIRVPRFGCRPLRPVEVRVVVADDTTEAVPAVLRPDEPRVDLSPGERRVLRGPDDELCLQFGESSSSEEYLVGVQSLSTVPGITSMVLTSETGGSSPGEVGAAPPDVPARRRAGDATGGRLLPADLPSRRPRPEARIREWELEHLAPRTEASLPRRARGGDGPPVARSHGPGGGPSVPGSVAEGDTVELRVPDVDADDYCAEYRTVRGVVREIGARGIWVEDTANPSSGYGADDWTAMSARFDELVYPVDTEYFGRPTDVDGNGRVVLVVTRVVNEAGYLGFVFAGDLFPRTGSSGSGCATSDEGEVAYLVAPDPEGIHGRPWTARELRDDNPRLAAHELAHVIQFGVRMACGACDWMPAFVSEGQAVVAEEVTAHEASGRAPGNEYGAGVVWEGTHAEWYDHRFVDLTRYHGWGGSQGRVEGAPEECSWLARDWAGPCLGSRGVYGVPSTVMRWMADHFGPEHPGGEAGFFRDMTASTEVGYANWEELTGLTMGEILAYWAPALWTDGRVPVADPMMTLPSWDLADIFDAVIPEARLRPHRRSFTDFREELGVNAGSSAYYLVAGDARPPTAVGVRAPDDSRRLGHVQVWVVRTR